MAGHSKWANIQHRKGRQDAKRGKVFTKLIKEITVAAKLGGGDPGGNPRLRKAITDARSNNMPMDNITRAIKKGTGELEGVNYEEVTYEAYGPGGTAVLVDVMTDNRNRAITDVRVAITKNGAKMAEPGAVGYLFSTVGQVSVAKAGKSEDEMMLLALDAGASDVQDADDHWLVTTGFGDLWTVRDALEQAGCSIADAKVAKVASTTIELGGKDAESMLKLMDALEDLDDVQNVWSNFDVDEDTAARLG